MSTPGVIFGVLCLLALTRSPAVSATSAAEAKSALTTQPLPLKSSRTLKFPVTQASWLSLDVSPDGETMVLEILGDLFLMPIVGGEAKPLTQGMAMDTQPRFSPDGRQIVFVSDRSGQDNLWLISLADGALRRLSRGERRVEFSSPTWSPDGQHVLASRSSWGLRTAELWAYDLRGGNGVRIAKAKADKNTPAAHRANHMGAVYSPDGRYLYYARKRGGFGYNRRLPLWQIARRDLRTETESLLTAAPGSAFRPVLSADGTQLAYVTREDQRSVLRLRDLRSGADRAVSRQAEADEQESRYTRDLFPNYAFGPSGRFLYFPAEGQPHRLDLNSGAQTAIAFSATVEVQLGPLNRYPQRLGVGPVKARVLMQPELTPDGSHLLFSAFFTVYRYNLDNGELVALTPANVQAFFPTASPDGRKVAYASWSHGGGHIFEVSARGGRARQVTRELGHYTNLAYAPDGKRLLAIRGNAYERLQREHDWGPTPGAEVVLVPIGRGASEPILPATGLSNLHFAKEADRVYFNRSNAATTLAHKGGLYSVRLDGTDERAELSVVGPGIYAAEGDVQISAITLSPNGRDLLLQHAGQLYLSALLNPWLVGQSLNLTDPQLPAVRLTDVGADSAGFSADGKRVYWTVGHTLLQRPIAEIEFPERFSKPANADATADRDTPDFASAQALEDATSVKRWPISVYRPRFAPEGMLALEGATLISMQGDEPESWSVNDSVVLIEGSRITAVGARGEVEIPAKATRIELGGQFLLPGFVDTHAHYRPLRGTMDRSNPSMQASLAYGVTTGLDVQPTTLDILAYEDAIDAGLMVGPRAMSTGPGIFNHHEFRSAEAAYHLLRRYRDHYGVRNLKAYISGDRQQRQWLAQAAAALKMTPTTEGSLDMKLDLTHVIDGFAGNEHNFPLQGVYDDVVQLVARSGIGYTPTLLVLFGGPAAEEYYYSRHSPAEDPKLRRFTPKPWLDRRVQRRGIWVSDAEQRYLAVAAAAQQIAAAGGLVGVGSHGQLQGLGFHWELWALASGGFDPLQALRAATIDGAKMIGVDQDIGSVAPGKLADLVVLARDPRKDLSATAELTRVIKGGVVYGADELAQQWPSKQPPPIRWWRRQEDVQHE